MFLHELVKRANKIILEYTEPVKYLNGRGITEFDIARYGIGYMRAVNIKEEDTEDYRTLSQDTYKFKLFQNKILFPLRNILGITTGLCTREIEKKQYNQHFLLEAKKTGAFFGLFEALPYIRKTGKVFVHEGAINAISFAKVFPNTISSLTSFLNETQYELLSFICDKIVVVYDEDTAGHIGVYKMKKQYGDKIIESISIGTDDSNTYLKMLGLQKFENYIKSKVPRYLQG